MTLFQFLSFVTFRHYNLLSIFLVGALNLHVIATHHDIYMYMVAQLIMQLHILNVTATHHAA